MTLALVLWHSIENCSKMNFFFFDVFVKLSLQVNIAFVCVVWYCLDLVNGWSLVTEKGDGEGRSKTSPLPLLK